MFTELAKPLLVINTMDCFHPAEAAQKKIRRSERCLDEPLIVQGWGNGGRRCVSEGK